MRTTTYVVLIVLTAVLFSSIGASQNTNRHGAASRKQKEESFATNQCLSKGGLGIIGGDVYIALRSGKNELRFGSKEAWSGLDSSKPEVAVFFENKVWPAHSLPKQFDLSSAVIVSFEIHKVRFFDFRNMAGGYYNRISE